MSVVEILAAILLIAFVVLFIIGVIVGDKKTPTIEHCGICHYYDRDTGHCHRFPPQIISNRTIIPDEHFPTPVSNTWCGEYKQRKGGDT